MRTSTELRQERQDLLDAQQNVINEARSNEGGEFNEAQSQRFDDLQGQVTALDGRIARAEQVEAVAAQRAAAQGVVVTPEGPDAEEREYNQMVQEYSLHRAMANQIEGRAQSGVEAEIQQELQTRAAASNVTVSGLLIPTEQRADQQTVTQDSGNFGANLVAEDLQSPISFLRPNPVVRQLGATYLTGLRGNVAFPVNKGGVAATWEGEITTVAASKNQYDKKTMVPHRLAATVGLSLQNILQANIDLERFTVEEINRVVSIAIDTAAFNGAGGGGNVPLGILNDTDTNALATAGANGQAPTWSEIVALETAVMNSNYQGTSYGYAINTKTKGKLKTTKHEAGDATYLMTGANEINGYNVGVSNLMPGNLTKGSGTDLSAAIFGDWSQLMIGQWGFMDMVLDNITGAKSGIIEVTVNSFLDIMTRHPEAFAHYKDWDTN